MEYVAGNGEVTVQSIDAEHLMRKDGVDYLCGWCSRLPCRRTVPVGRINTLADVETGELVRCSDVAEWLAKRSLH